MSIDTSYFLDIADSMGISSPTIIEKDYYAVQLLKELSTISLSGYTLVFAGGTSLLKAHFNTFRMSEDIDIKLVPSLDILKESRSKQKKLRKGIEEAISEKLNASSLFFIKSIKKRDEGKYQHFLVEYPKEFAEINALRPELQLEITESGNFDEAVEKPVSSMYAEAMKLQPEIKSILCASVELTASEKFIALLRRIAAFERNPSQKDDATLVRHVYDLHLIINHHPNLNKITELVEKVIQNDILEFGTQHIEFKRSPKEELNFGLEILLNDHKYKDRYERFIGPLVFHPSPASWDEAIKTVEEMAERLLGK